MYLTLKVSTSTLVLVFLKNSHENSTAIWFLKILMTSPPLQFINFFIGETNVFIILQKFFFPLEFWSKNKQLHFQTKFGSNCLKNSKIIWGVSSSHQYSNQNSWRIPWEFCSQLQLHFQPEFWSKFLKNSHLNLWFLEEFSSLKVINFSYWQKFCFLIGILIKTLEDF